MPKASEKEGFTLIELLVVIAIIAIIASVIAILINPLEITRRGRDSNRLSDMANVQHYINLTSAENSAVGSTIFCAGVAGPCGGSTAGTPAGSPGNGSSVTGTRAINGSGWVRVDLTKASSIIQPPVLPRDPVNSAGFHYTYCGSTTGAGGYELATVMESITYTVTQPKMVADGGGDNNIYEVGSNLGLTTVAGTTPPATVICKF